MQLFMLMSDVRYLRLKHKFEENDYQKIGRLIELHEKYCVRVEETERKWNKEHPEDVEENKEAVEERYLRRIDSGLFTLQLLCFVIGFVATADSKLRDRIELLLNQRDSSLSSVKGILQEYDKQMDSQAVSENSQRIRTVLSAVLSML